MKVRRLTRSEHWKNFRLGEELDVSGTFIYNGLRRFHEIRNLNSSADIFEIFYHLSVGIERLMKIAIVLVEHEDTNNQEAFEKSLLTHNLQALLARLEKHRDLGLSNPDHAFLHLLTEFYENLRYDRFSLGSPLELGKERHALFDFLERQLGVKFDDRGSIFGQPNTEQYKKFIQRIAVKIASALYEVVKQRASDLQLFSYELPKGSKAETVFLRKAAIPTQEVLWKELLVFFMNTKETSGYLEFLRGIKPLPFDPGLVSDYLDCFHSDSARSHVVDELEYLYGEEVPNTKERLQMMGAIATPGLSFDEPEDTEDGIETL